MRVRRSSEYRRIQAEGERVHTPHFVLLVCARSPRGGEGERRLGLVVSRKVGSAVRRNRVKRLLREVFRRNPSLFPDGSDIVIVAKRGATALGYEQVRSEVASVRSLLARRAERSRRRGATGARGVKEAR